ncbi:MAG: DUF721 domain-containing protein [Bryobacterales bacterium]|nr:DUF721 domain-containing protein [Opitutaceae bacterium]MCZ2156197.1 DUF721 domain-containing protein [Bryobacterales bacterium]
MTDQDPPKFSRIAEELIGSLRRIPNDDPRGLRRRPIHELSHLIGELQVKYGIGLETPEHVIREQWAEIVGSANASYSHAGQIDPRGRLIVFTSHAIIRNELFLHRKNIVDKLRKLPGCEAIREIILRSG